MDQDDTLIFEKHILDAVFAEALQYVVAINIKLASKSTGFIVNYTDTHRLVAVYSDLLSGHENEPITVRHSDGIHSTVDHIENLPNCRFSILYARMSLDKPRPVPQFADLGAQDCEKVVTVFPYKEKFMIFKGHVTLKDCTREDIHGNIIPGGDTVFMFTCPVAGSYAKDKKKDRDVKDKWNRVILGAPVFNLEGRILGSIDSCSNDYLLKFAKKSSAFSNLLNEPGLLNWQAGSSGGSSGAGQGQ